MPELPEVETVRKVLTLWCENKEVKKLFLFYENLLENTTLNELNNLLVGSKITQIKRLGKYLMIIFDDYHVLISHLRMEGKWNYGHFASNNKQIEDGICFDYSQKVAGKAHKHTHFIIEFSDGHLLMYEDSRKFGRIHLTTQDKMLEEAPLQKLGYEPFNEKLDAQYLQDKFKRMGTTIKQALLDQSIIAGLGNIYVDEVLFSCGLLPTIKAKQVGIDKLALIKKHSVEILNKAIQEGGSTVMSYHAANDVDGKFQNYLNVYGRAKKTCHKCQATIIKIFVGGRGTCFCPQCQKSLIKNRVIGITGAIGSGKSAITQLFAQKYQILDADQIAKQGQQIDGPLYPKILKIFKNQPILNDDKSLNRPFINRLINESKELKTKLEKLVHPYVKEKMIEEIIFNPDKKYILDVPLLFEAKINELCDKVILITCEEKIRRTRLEKRNIPNVDELMKLGNTVKRNKADHQYDFIVDNSADWQESEEQINKIIASL